jgi:toxin FitB
MSFLVDTNVLAELRKGKRTNPRVRTWFEGLAPDDIWLSVLTIGEIRKGIESVRRRDERAARALERWLRRVSLEHGERILSVDLPIVEVWAGFNVPDPLPVIDSLLAATAKVHGLTVATRNVKDVSRTGVPFVDPFDT